ncbi:MAG: arsenate reductase (glutaredoxin) [Sulfitobacter sp.]
MITIWHNPRCSKSRQTLALIEAGGQACTVRKYLEDVPSQAELAAAFQALGIAQVTQMMRCGEAAFRDSGLSADSLRGDLFDLMQRHPIVIERPIVFRGVRAVIGRPPEAVQPLL